ncbi:hypothetical protein VNO77_15506 [Canavalia gladiata]|uniref:Uncharacterized protein n=1 Tax=Canavalia gladiata TaxID=3824 RepID=A0AAN9LZ26_CANGL
MARWLVRMARGLGRVGRLASRLEGLTKIKTEIVAKGNRTSVLEVTDQERFHQDALLISLITRWKLNFIGKQACEGTNTNPAMHVYRVFLASYVDLSKRGSATVPACFKKWQQKATQGNFWFL